MESEFPNSPPQCSYHLVTSTDAVAELSESLKDQLDEMAGIQATITLEEFLADHPYDIVLRNGKIGTRRGKPLVDVYLEKVRDRISAVDESELADDLEAQFGRNNADPYEAALTGNVLSIGVNVLSGIKRRLDAPDDVEFNVDDLRAAVEFAAKEADLGTVGSYGTIIVQSDRPLSDFAAQGSTGRLARRVQELLLSNFDVHVVGPSGGPDELDTIRDQFRSLGRFTIEQETQVQFDQPESVERFLDQWYDRLSFTVADGRVRESVIRPASVTAYDLPQGEERRHFFGAIVHGLQVAYAEKKLDRKEFDRLRSERITDHPKYDKYRSRYTDFPAVKIGRSDGRQQVFRFTYQGPTTKPHIDGIPVQSNNLEEAFVDILERYLDASVLDEAQWTKVVETVEDGIGRHLDIDHEAVADSALLRRTRVRTELQPALPPSEDTDQVTQAVDPDRDASWYREHWNTILSGFEVSTGTKAIKRKRELCAELDPESVADTTLYHKLKRDIANAWDYYQSELEKQIRVSLPDNLGVNLEWQDHEGRTDLVVTTHPSDAVSVETTVSIYLPFSNVHVEGKQVSKATVSNVVSRVIETFEDVLYIRDAVSGVDQVTLTLEIIRLYCRVADVDAGDVVYFEEVAEFVRTLPGVADAFREPNQNLTESVYDRLSDPNLLDKLRDSGIIFHLKGSDDRKSIKSKGNQYISMELRDGIP
jgi:hypothetical protein